MLLALLLSLLHTNDDNSFSTRGHFTHEPRAESRDREVMRAQKKVSKGRLKTPPDSCRCGHKPLSVV